jgi:hypothetical protein
MAYKIETRGHVKPKEINKSNEIEAVIKTSQPRKPRIGWINCRI